MSDIQTNITKDQTNITKDQTNITNDQTNIIKTLTNTPTDVPLFGLDSLETYAKIIDVHDGDTVTAIIYVPFIEKLFKWKCRLDNIDTPELNTKDLNEKEKAIAAREYLKSLILFRIVKIKCHKFEKYGRLLVTIYDNSGQSINDQMVSNDYGRYYDGRKKEPWIFKMFRMFARPLSSSQQQKTT